MNLYLFTIGYFLLCLCLLSIHADNKRRWFRLDDRNLKVTTILIEPYMMLDEERRNQTGNDKYYGYIADLLSELSDYLGFSYQISVAPGNSYGYKQSESSWDGMVGQIFREEVELAAGPLYITDHRKEVVQFTLPFITAKATMLLRKPTRGTEHPIRTISDIINQSEIKYGTLEKGIIVRAFKKTNDTLSRIMYRNMLRLKPSTFTSTNEEGIERVRSDKYAFILPNTIGEYIAHQLPCDLVTIDNFLMERGYGLAVQKGDKPLSRALNKGLRVLQKTHTLQHLYKKWWVDKSECRIKSSKMYSDNGNTAISSTYSVSLIVVSFCNLISNF